MKKLLATLLTIYIIGMSFVLIGGFLQKQITENGAIKKASTLQSKSSTTRRQALATTSKSYTGDEVKQHNSYNNCWLIINNKVYNITAFLPQHPGGAVAILQYCGQDATQAFSTKGRSSGGGHSDQANNILQNYLVGNLKK